MYIPYGGFKSATAPVLKDPIFKQGFRDYGAGVGRTALPIIDYQKFVEIDTDVKSYIWINRTESVLLQDVAKE